MVLLLQSAQAMERARRRRRSENLESPELLSLNAELKATQQAMRRIKKGASDPRGRRAFEATCRALVVGAGGQTSVAACFWERASANDRGGEAQDALVARLASWWETSTAEEKRRCGAEPVTACERAACRRAEKFRESCRLHDWVQDHNVRHALAPSSGAILRMMEHEPTAMPTTRALRPAQRKYRFQWLRRWRSRWGVKIQSMTGKTLLEDDTMQRKARGSTILNIPPHPV